MRGGGGGGGGGDGGCTATAPHRDHGKHGHGHCNGSQRYVHNGTGALGRRSFVDGLCLLEAATIKLSPI